MTVQPSRQVLSVFSGDMDRSSCMLQSHSWVRLILREGLLTDIITQLAVFTTQPIWHRKSKRASCGGNSRRAEKGVYVILNPCGTIEHIADILIPTFIGKGAVSSSPARPI